MPQAPSSEIPLNATAAGRSRRVPPEPAGRSRDGLLAELTQSIGTEPSRPPANQPPPPVRQWRRWVVAPIIGALVCAGGVAVLGSLGPSERPRAIPEPHRQVEGRPGPVMEVRVEAPRLPGPESAPNPVQEAIVPATTNDVPSGEAAEAPRDVPQPVRSDPERRPDPPVVERPVVQPPAPAPQPEPARQRGWRRVYVPGGYFTGGGAWVPSQMRWVYDGPPGALPPPPPRP